MTNEIFEGAKKYQLAVEDTEGKPEGYYRVSKDVNNYHIEWYLFETNSIFAGAMGFKQINLFELESEEERKNIVKF